jgi:DNA invertase Pin-like site-specific DNA recombinase
MSRPRFEPIDPQRQLVKSLAAYGIGQEEIARKIGVSAKTLRRHFREELDRGATDANARVEVPPKNVAFFKPSKELRELVNRI